MSIALPARTLTAAQVAEMQSAQIAELLNGYMRMVETLRHQVEWFKRQLFGQKLSLIHI